MAAMIGGGISGDCAAAEAANGGDRVHEQNRQSELANRMTRVNSPTLKVLQGLSDCGPGLQLTIPASIQLLATYFFIRFTHEC